MAHGDYPAQGTHCNSLRLLGSVGEPINPQAWQWYYETIGKSRCPIVDTWWQTETGGIMITPLPGVTALKPGAASMPFFGIQPAIVDKHGQELLLAAEGNLVIRDSWPGQARTVYGDHARFIQTYFSTYENQYFTGDGEIPQELHEDMQSQMEACTEVIKSKDELIADFQRQLRAKDEEYVRALSKKKKKRWY